MYVNRVIPTGYFDHAATTAVRPAAAEAFSRQLAVVGNPAALHVAGQRARRALEEAREQLAATVGAHSSEVVFTAGGSEADSIALLGGMAAQRSLGRQRCLVSAIEHPAVLGMQDHGAELIPVSAAGIVDLEAGLGLIDQRVGMVSVMSVNNETGIVQPLEQLQEQTRAVGAWFHSDAVQALGHIPLDFRASGMDLMSISGHKVGAPVGIGALLVRRSIKLTPIGLGGGQEREIRSGTGAIALASAFAVAASEAVAELAVETTRLERFQTQIAAAVTSCGGQVNSFAAPHASHILNVTFEGVRAGDLLFLLDQRGIYASVGSACRAGVHQPSQVLLAMGRSVDQAASSLRFSLGHSTTQAEVDYLVAELPGCVEWARGAFSSNA